MPTSTETTRRHELAVAAGRGTPPDTWPVREQVVDVAHKGVYAVVTGLVCDAVMPPSRASRRGRRSH
jgi:hypothetical protein